MGEVERLTRQSNEAVEEAVRKVSGLCEDPTLMAEDHMMTERDETEVEAEEERGVEHEAGPQGQGNGLTNSQTERERRGWGPSPPALQWLSRGEGESAPEFSLWGGY